MQKLNYEPIPKEASKFIIIGNPAHLQSNNINHNDVQKRTSDDIEFLKREFQKYSDKCSSNEIYNQKKQKKNSNMLPKIPPIQTSNSPKSTDNRSLKSVSVYDRRKQIVLKKPSQKIRSNTANDNNNDDQNYNIYERTPEYLFIKQCYKEMTKQKLVEYQKICEELTSIISTIIQFVQIHFEQKIPISVDHNQFLEYCSSFFNKKDSLYMQLTKREEIYYNKLQQLSQYTKYKIVTIDQLKTELNHFLNFEYEDDQNQQKEKKQKNRQKQKGKTESNTVKTATDTKKQPTQPFFLSNIDYAPYSKFDDSLFYFIHSNNVFNSNIQFRDSPEIEIQKIALEITGIAERNLSFKPNKESNEESNPNYSLFNGFLTQLFQLVLKDGKIFDKIKDKERMMKIYQHQIKTVITIAFTRIIFDAAYLFNYDYLLNDLDSEKNRQYLHFNEDDEVIQVNSTIIQSLLPRDLDIPDGFLIDYSMHKSRSQQNLQSNSMNPDSDNESDTDSDVVDDPNIPLCSSVNSNSSIFSFIPIKGSSKTIHDLMVNDDDFLIMSEKLNDIQFYSNPFDLAYIVHWIFTRIQSRMSKIHQLTTKKIKSTDNILRENGLPRSKSREFDAFVQFDDLFLFFLTVFTFSPPKNARWIAAMLKRFTKLVSNMALQQSASFFIAVVNYISSFPSNEEFSPELIDHIQQMRDELSSHNA